MRTRGAAVAASPVSGVPVGSISKKQSLCIERAARTKKEVTIVLADGTIAQGGGAP
jgi:hypothetical protein